MKISNTWKAGLPPNEVEELEMKLKGAEVIFKRLTYLFDQKKKDAVRTQLLQANYESPSWAHKQADSIGYQRAITELLSLIKQDD
jgi:hypothetical protein